MTQRLVIVGAGYTGLRLAERAIDEGMEVVGTTRSDETEAALESLGATVRRWDAEDGVAALEASVASGSAVVYSVPTLFSDYEGPGEGAGEGNGEARHVTPVTDVLALAEGAGAERFIYLSSTSVYGDHEGAWVDEEDACEPTAPIGKMRRDIERAVLGHDGGVTTNVARLVGIYGPGRTLARYIESGRYQIVDRDKPTNRIHVDDIVTSVMAMIERGGEQNRLFNVSDGNPKKVGEVVDWLVREYGLEAPGETSLEAYAEKRSENAVARWANTYRVDNSRLLEELDVELAYPTVFDGYREILGE